MTSNFCYIEDFWNKTRLWLRQNLNCMAETQYIVRYDVENPNPNLVEKYRLRNQIQESQRNYNQKISILSKKIESLSNRLEHLEFDVKSHPKTDFKQELQNLEEKITIRIDKFDDIPEENTQNEIEVLKKSIHDLGDRVGKLNNECWVNVSN